MSCGRVFSRKSTGRGRARNRTGATGLLLLKFGGLHITITVVYLWLNPNLHYPRMHGGQVPLPDTLNERRFKDW